MLKSYINQFNLKALMHKRNRVILFLLTPIIVFIGFIGWSLYCIGSKADTKPRKICNQNKPTFNVQIPKKKYAT